MGGTAIAVIVVIAVAILIALLIVWQGKQAREIETRRSLASGFREQAEARAPREDAERAQRIAEQKAALAEQHEEAAATQARRADELDPDR